MAWKVQCRTLHSWHAMAGVPSQKKHVSGGSASVQVGKVATSPLPSRGSPPLQSGGGKSEVAHLWAKWLRHPCRLGDPHSFRAGGKITSGPLVGKVATSPLPSRGSPPLQSGRQNQKWPTCGQSGYVTPAVSGIPTAAERGAKSEVAHLWAKWLRHPYRLGDPHRFRAGGGGSEVAHLWAKWLRHPCRLGDPNRFRAGGKIRSGPLVGKVATSPLPSRGSPPLQSGRQNQKWPTCGESGYVTPAVTGIPTAAERGGKSEVAHLWAKWLRHPCRLGDRHHFKAAGKIRSGPLVGKVATLPLPSRGSPPLQSGGGKSEVAHLWAKWLRHPCRLGDPHSFRAGGKITSGPLVGKVATSPLPSRGSPPLQSGRQNQKWPTCGQSGYVTPAVSGIPTAAERGAKSEVAHLWAKWLRHPCRLGDPHHFRAAGKIRSGPLVGKVATLPLPSRGSPPLQSGGRNQKWPTCGQSGYVTPAVSGIPTAAERGGGGELEVAHLWAKWLRHPCRLGDPHRFRAGGEIRSGPLVGKVATSPLPSRGSPPLQSGGQNQKWPTCGQSGYVTPAVSGIPTTSERQAKSEVAHLWAKWLRYPCRLGDPHRCRAGGEIRSGPLVGKVATSPLLSRGSPPLQSGGGGESEVAHLWGKWLRHPCRLGDPHRFRAGGEIRSGPLVGKVATSPLPSRGSPPLQSGRQNQKWPTCGQSGYVTPAVSGIPTAAERGGEIRSGPLVGKVATSPLPARGSPQFQSGGQNHKWPTCGQSGYVTPAVSGIATTSERQAKSEVAHLWAKWLRHPCRLGDPHRCRAGGKIRSGPLVGKVATSPLPSRGSPPLQSGRQNQKWPTCGQSGYVTPAVSGIPTAAERGAKSEVAHLWAKWLRHPCRLGDPHRCRAGGGGKSEVAHLWAKWLRHPCRLGDPHRFRAGGGNQKWPTCGQSGYVTPAVSGIPTAAERGAKSEVAHLWAKWLRHPCRLGDPHHFRAAGKIRSGPLVGKVATLPLPSRGSPPLQSGGRNQKWPTCGQSGYVTPAVSGIPTAAERRGGEIRSGPLVGKVATSPLPSWGSPPLQSGGGNQKWPTCGQSGYVTPAVSGIPTAAERGAKSEVAHLWAKWLRHPCRLGDPHHFRAAGKIRSGPLVGKVATLPLPSRGSPPLQSGGRNQKWPTCGQSGYVTPAVSGIPTAAERGAKSEVAHLWAKWLRHPCRLGDPHRFRAGGEIRSGPLVGKVAT